MPKNGNVGCLRQVRRAQHGHLASGLRHDGGAPHYNTLGHVFLFVTNLDLDFFNYFIAFQTAGTNFYREGGAFDLGFYFYQIGFPNPPGAVLGMAHFIAGSCMFSA